GSLDPVHFGHLDIHQHHVKALVTVCNHFHRLTPVTRLRDRGAHHLQQLAGYLPVELVIFHQQQVEPLEIISLSNGGLCSCCGSVLAGRKEPDNDVVHVRLGHRFVEKIISAGCQSLVSLPLLAEGGKHDNVRRVLQ